MILGIDPGKSGGLAWVGGSAPLALAMPHEDVDLWAALGGDVKPSHAFLERVHAMPKQGVSSTFTFGQEYGRLRMALVAAEIPFETVTPRKWQAGLGIAKRGPNETKEAFKGRLKARAQELFPSLRVTLKTADALLIAEWGRREIARRDSPLKPP